MQRKNKFELCNLNSYVVFLYREILLLVTIFKKIKIKKKETRKKSCVARYINVSENRLGRAVKNKVFVTDF